MQKRDLPLSVNVIILTLLLSSSVLAVLNPSVIEEFDEDWRVEYTVINPADSSIGDIVGFVIEVDYEEHLWASAYNGWLAQGWTDAPLSATTWDLNMTDDYSVVSALTWRQFFGGIDYPFGTVEGVGYYVNYNEVALNTFKFDWSFSEAPYHLPILPGETLDGFLAYLVETASQYLLAYMDDAEHDTFSDSGLPSFRGEAIPEPATICLLGLGALSMLRRKK